MARFTVANDDDRKNRDDNSRVDFFDATVWGAQAEALAKYAPASRRILIEGVPHVERYTAKDGTNRRHFNITVQAFQFMDERIPETPVEKADPLPDNFAADEVPDAPFAEPADDPDTENAQIEADILASINA